MNCLEIEVAVRDDKNEFRDSEKADPYTYTYKCFHNFGS